jgi:hypothetical protein
MNKTLNVLEAQDFKEKGMFFYCTNDDIQSRDKNEILNWFGSAKKIILENGNEFNIMSIGPMISFTNIGSALIKVDTKTIPMGIYPISAIIH